MVTETMMLLAVRQSNWQQVTVMARELAREKNDPFFDAVARAAEQCLTNGRAQVLLSLWAELCWRLKQ